MNIDIRHERMTEDGRRIASRSAENGGFAGIYNDAGYGIANIDRLARIDGDGDLGFVHDHIADNDEPRAHATTDEEWRSLVRLLGAAPEMLAVLKSLRRSMERLEDWRSIDATDIDSIIASDGLRVIDAMLDKVEPRRVVRSTVWVTVAVEVETTPGEASEPGNVCMAAVEAVRDGEGEIVRDEIIEIG